MSTGVYKKTTGDLIRDALRASNISGIALEVDETDFEQARVTLNDILAWLQTKQIHLWSQTEAILPLVKGKAKYTLPGDHAYTNGAYTITTAANNGPAIFDLNGEVLLEIDPNTLLLFEDDRIRVKSIDGFSVGFNVGIELPNGTIWWDTISQVNTSELWFKTASEWPSFINKDSVIYVYENEIDQPVRILDARYSWRYDNDQTTAMQMARKDYFDQPSKATSGSVNSWYYDRQLEAGYLYVWPVPDSGKEVLRFTFIKPQYIPEDQAEDLLVPPEWYLPLKNKLAAELGIVYAIDPTKQALLEAKAENFIEDALGTDDEFSSFLFYPSCY